MNTDNSNGSTTQIQEDPHQTLPSSIFALHFETTHVRARFTHRCRGAAHFTAVHERDSPVKLVLLLGLLVQPFEHAFDTTTHSMCTMTISVLVGLFADESDSEVAYRLGMLNGIDSSLVEQRFLLGKTVASPFDGDLDIVTQQRLLR